MSENVESAKTTNTITDDEFDGEDAAELVEGTQDSPQSDGQQMAYSWIYLLGEKGNPKKTKIGLTTKENPLRRYKEMATGNTQLYLFMAYRLPAWYAEQISIEENTWHDFFADPGAAPGPTAGDAVGKRPAKRIGADRIRNHFAESTSGKFEKVKASTRLKRWDGGNSEWFMVKPEDAAAVIGEYIGAAKADRWVNYEFNAVSHDYGSREKKPIAANEMIFCYTEKALREEFEGTQYTSSEKPVELCNLDTNALQSLSHFVLNSADKEAQEHEINAELEKLLSWLDNVEGKIESGSSDT